ncbi:MAG: carboxypeptidase-like regulatory domain-containing protein [Bacteroidota bacterium]
MNKSVLLVLMLTFSQGVFAQVAKVTVSGLLKEKSSKAGLPYVNVILKNEKDSTFVTGTVSDSNGRFALVAPPGNYVLDYSYIGYKRNVQSLLVGKLSEYLDLGEIELEESTTALSEVVVAGQKDDVAETLEKKTFTVSDNINQSGGSLLQVMQNLPGITISQDGTVRLRGNDRVAVLIDGKQTALTGFGNQTGLDNIITRACVN